MKSGVWNEVLIPEGNPVTYNETVLAARMLPALKRISAEGAFFKVSPSTTAEDFSRYRETIPGLFFFGRITPRGIDPSVAGPNHSPRFFSDEGALVVGVRAMACLAVDFLSMSR